MLASLERDAKARTGGSTGTRRFGKVQGIALLAVALLAGAGAYVVLAPGDDAPVRSAATPSARGVAATQPGVAASAASGSSAPAAVAAASAPTLATAQIEPAPAPAAASAPVVAAAGASTDVTGASAPAGIAVPALARSDADGSLTAKASASAPGSRSKKAQAKESGAKSLAAGVTPSKSAAVRSEAAPARPARKDDEDADTALVAAMIARLDRRGAALGLPAAAAVRKDDGPALVESLRQCELKTDPLDARRCRNRACETHWGKAEACPAARAPKGSLGQAVEHGKPA